MADNKGQNTIVGVFALVGILVMCGLVLMFGGGKSLFASTYVIKAKFPHGVVGVQSGQRVYLKGKQIGETVGVEFVNREQLDLGVAVRVAVDAEYAIPQSSEMVVHQNLMGIGSPFIAILVMDPLDTTTLSRDGSSMIEGKMVNPLEQMLPREMQTTFATALEQIGDLAGSLKPVAENLNRLMEERNLDDVESQQVTANLDTVVQRLDRALRSIEAVIGNQDNQDNLHQILANTRHMSEIGIEAFGNFSRLAARSQGLADRMDDLLKSLIVASDNVSSAFTELDKVLAAMNTTDGTAGLLLNDNRLYEEMLLSTKRLTKALDDMREVMDMAKRGELRIKAF